MIHNTLIMLKKKKCMEMEELGSLLAPFNANTAKTYHSAYNFGH